MATTSTAQADPVVTTADVEPNMATQATESSDIALREQSYETQFLGFAPKSFCDGLYNAVLDYTWEYFSASQDYMKSQFTDIVKKEEMLKASEVFLGAVSQALDKAFDKFEYYVLTNILCIPADVVLPEDAAHREYAEYTPAKCDELDADLAALKDRVRAARYFNMSLRKEMASADIMIKEYARQLELLRGMDKIVRESGVADIRESLVFAVGKSNRLLDKLEELRSLTSDDNKRPLPDRQELAKLEKKIKLGN